MINVVVCLQFAYAFHIGDERLKEKAISMLESIPAEKNYVVSEWKSLGVNCLNAARTQGALELYHEHCTNKKCLECMIGQKILLSTTS